MIFVPQILQVLLGVTFSALAAASPASAACEDIDAALPGRLAYPLRDLIRYEDELHNYWSQADADYRPECIVFPLSAADTSQAVQVLDRYESVRFAVKSGGHNTNQGWSSVDGGVLIAFSNNAATNISADQMTADIGPGARWGDVMVALEPYGKGAVGGRIGDVGVGGYVLGGGLSFLSGEYGLACDNVVNFEAVLANGSTVNANATSEPELFYSLKGGGNQFAIVTKFTLKTVPMGQIWGGVRTYAGSPEVAKTFTRAVQDFTANYNDPKAAVIVTVERTAIINLWVIFYFYNAPSPPPDAFSAFESEIALTDTVKTQSFASLLKANNDFNLEGLRYLIRGTTLPNLPGEQGVDVLHHQFTIWSQQAVAQTLSNVDFLYSMAYQPIPAAIARASHTQGNGSNALGLDPKSGDHVWMEYDISWLAAFEDSEAHKQAMQITNSINTYVHGEYGGVQPTNYEVDDAADTAEGTNNETGLSYLNYNPTFLNDAMYDQDVLQTYPASSYQRLVEAKAAYDPMGFFTNRTGGFKL